MSASTNPSLRDRLALAQQLFEQFYLQCFWHFPPDFRVKTRDIPDSSGA